MAVATTLMQRRKRDAIEEIASAALELFLRDGFDATSVEAIAAGAGCSPRTFYRYFGTKEDVMFHDLPGYLDQLRHDLDAHLAEGLDPWAAVSESVVEFIDRFAPVDEQLPTQRMNLWLNEPALLGRYLQYVHQAEHIITDSICRHRGKGLERDDLTHLMAAAAIAATRVTLLTHTPTKNRSFSAHLRDALATLGGGLGDTRRDEATHSRRAKR
jgi:AcrR family transcriptional regulator